jgi:DNA-binding response OmpR family regulator
MATVKRTPSAVLAPRSESAVVGGRAAPPHLLRCLVVSFAAERRRLIRAAAEAQTWDAIVCRDAGEFLRMAFKRSVPLIVVDLPGEETSDYWELRHATDKARQITQSLLVVAGTGAEEREEIWARSLGALAYMNEAHSQRGFEFVLNEARQAIERHAGLLETSQYAGAKQDGW